MILAIEASLLEAGPLSAKVEAPAPELVSKPSEPARQLAPALELGLGASGGLGALPQPSAGLTVGAAVRWNTLSVGLEARFNPPGSVFLRGGEIETSRQLGLLLACAHRGWFAACALATGGAMQVEGRGFDDPARATLPYLAAGARSLAELPLNDALSLRGHLDLSIPLLRHSLWVSGEPAWTSPPLSADLGVGVAVQLK